VQDNSNTINLKIFPTRPPPPPVYAWHVPLSTVRLSDIAKSSDLTLTRIIPFIDGVTSVAHIAIQADADLNLTRKAISQLLYYNCIILLDIFQYNAIYAPTAEFAAFVDDVDAQDEGIRYVSVGTYRKLAPSELPHIEPTAGKQDRWGWIANESGLDRAQLVALYSGLNHGMTLKKWCLLHSAILLGIDVRRFITFGVIKGFLYRVHKYAILEPDTGGRFTEQKNVLDSSQVTNWQEGRRPSAEASIFNEVSLSKYLDGLHCFDEICTELQISEKEVIKKMKKDYNNAVIIHR